MVHIPSAHKEQLYRHLFKEGCVVVSSASTMKGHETVKFEDGTLIPNLYVKMIMRSMKSRNYARETFSWQKAYYFVTDEGFEHIRNYLGLPEGTKPEIAERQVEEKQRRQFSGRSGERRPYQRDGRRPFSRAPRDGDVPRNRRE